MNISLDSHVRKLGRERLIKELWILGIFQGERGEADKAVDGPPRSTLVSRLKINMNHALSIRVRTYRGIDGEILGGLFANIDRGIDGLELGLHTSVEPGTANRATTSHLLLHVTSKKADFTRANVGEGGGRIVILPLDAHALTALCASGRNGVGNLHSTIGVSLMDGVENSSRIQPQKPEGLRPPKKMRLSWSAFLRFHGGIM